MTDALVHEAEKIALGCVLLDPSTIDHVMDRLRSRDFADVRHGSIFATVVAQHAAGDDTGPVAVALALQAVGELARVGGGPYLHDCVAAVPTSVQAGYYASIVADAAAARRVAVDAVRLAQAAESGDVEKIRSVQAGLVEQWTAQGRPAENDSWSPVDLGPYLRGEVKRAEPTVGLARSDGLRLLYPGKEHAVVGEMESAKSWILIASAVAEMNAGNRVVYIHWEDADPGDTLERLVALGAREADVLDLFRFVGPARPVRQEELARLLEPVPSLVIHDGVNEAMAMHGWGIRDEEGAASFRRHLVFPCTAAGAATVCADHVVKDREARGRNALGSIHKGNGLTGALIMLENAEPFGRSQRGRSHVYVTKDRPGHLRQHGRPTKMPGKTFMGELVVDDTRQWNPWLELTFHAPAAVENDEAVPADAKEGERQEVDDQVYGVVVAIAAKGSPVTGRAVRARSTYGNEKTADALARLVLAGRLTERDGPRNARIYAPTGPEDQLTIPLPDQDPSGVSGPVPRRGGPGPDHSSDRSRPVAEPLGTTQDHSTRDQQGQPS